MDISLFAKEIPKGALSYPLFLAFYFKDVAVFGKTNLLFNSLDRRKAFFMERITGIYSDIYTKW